MIKRHPYPAPLIEGNAVTGTRVDKRDESVAPYGKAVQLVFRDVLDTRQGDGIVVDAFISASNIGLALPQRIGHTKTLLLLYSRRCVHGTEQEKEV
jgi:hypothetical protein